MAVQDDPMQEVPGDGADVHVVRLLDEFLKRQEAGSAPGEEDLLAAHPECAAELREHLALVRHLTPRHHRIAELLSRGILQSSPSGQCAALLDDYQVHRVLGEGGMGIVLDGYDPRLQRRIALKVLRPELAGDAVALERLEREAKAAGALQHPNVVTIYSLGMACSAPYIVMERVGGPSLAAVVHMRGPLPAPTVREIFCHILDALAAAHQAGLIHRDIKSSNILVVGLDPVDAAPDTGEGARDMQSPTLSASVGPSGGGAGDGARIAVKIADFGLARLRSSRATLTEHGSVLGTPDYMSPEQARGDTEIDHRTDLYSAGVVLYEMLTGRTPFHADTPTATIRRILDEVPQDPRQMNDGADPHLASLALRLMAKAPDDRLPSAREALAVLKSAKPVRPVLPRDVRRRRTALAVVGALGAVLLAWAMSGLFADTRRIVDARLKPGRDDVLEVRYEGAGSFTPFVELPSGAHISSLEGTPLIDLDSGREQAVVFGLRAAQTNGNMIAYDRGSEELWGAWLPGDRDTRWPDCGQPMVWSSVLFATGDVDKHPGDEIIAVAFETAGPTQLAVLEPRGGAILSGFYHSGHINHVVLSPDFFGPKRPALIAAGCNNVLDDFDHPPRAEQELEKPIDWSSWVPALMILDPAEMNGGIGPPRIAQLPYKPLAGVHAYGFFLPLPRRDPDDVTADTSKLGDGSRARPALRFETIQSVYESDEVLTIHADILDPQTSLGAVLVFDVDLHLTRVEPSGEHESEIWHAHWRRLVPAHD